MAWKISKGLYVMPLLFAYTPFLSGDWDTAIQIFLLGILGLYALTGAMEGYLESRVTLPMRLVLALIGGTLLWPSPPLELTIAAICGFIIVITLNVRTDRRDAKAAQLAATASA